MLQTLGTALSREQLKKITGGEAPGGGGFGTATCVFYGSCVAYTDAPTQSYDPDDTAVANNMQSLADDWCYAHDCCTNADCPGATS